MAPLERYEQWRKQHQPTAPRGLDLQALQSRDKQGIQTKHRGPLLSPWEEDPTKYFLPAANLSHPLTEDPRLEANLWYPIAAVAALGPAVQSLQREAEQMTRSASRAVAAIDRWAMKQRPPYTQNASIQSLKPAWMALVIAMLDWPDHSLPRDLIQGSRCKDC